MTAIELLEIIEDLQKEKREAGMHPDFVQRYELWEMLGSEIVIPLINELIRDDKIIMGDTMNDFYYRVKK